MSVSSDSPDKPSHALDQAPDYARAIAFARDAQHAAARSRTVAMTVLGSTMAGICAVSSGFVHARPSTASLGAAADDLTANPHEDLDMRARALGVAAMVAVNSTAFAGEKVPAGWMVIADSATGLPSSQGEDGWFVLFDRGAGTQPEFMPYYTSSVGQPAWCAAPNLGGSGGADHSHCFVLSGSAHPNAAGDCDTPAAGLQRPIRKWVAPVPMRTILVWDFEASAVCSGLLFQLKTDDAVHYEFVSEDGSNAVQHVVMETPLIESAWFVADPLDSCQGDGFFYRLVVLTPDCNENLIADAVEIEDGSVSDLNSDGIPDSCQCFGDVIPNGLIDGADLSALLSVWGTNGGLYPRADCNSDGTVGGQDLAIVLSGWGACP
jgi:hypothetical protein